MEWVNIRGPIGAPRWDWYVTRVLAQLVALNPHVTDVDAEDLVMPWLRPGEVPGGAFIRPWLTKSDDD